LREAAVAAGSESDAQPALAASDIDKGMGTLGNFLVTPGESCLQFGNYSRNALLTIATLENLAG
jgi:hypothetical protein